MSEITLPLRDTAFRDLIHVKRWNVIAVSRDQSVAEHTAQVIAISRLICNKLGFSAQTRLEIIEYALLHDLHEVMMGDMPTCAKEYRADFRDGHHYAALEASELLRNATTARGLIQWVVKLADLLEAHIYIKEYGVGTRAYSVGDELYEKIEEMLQGENIWLSREQLATLGRLVWQI